MGCCCCAQVPVHVVSSGPRTRVAAAPCFPAFCLSGLKLQLGRMAEGLETGATAAREAVRERQTGLRLDELEMAPRSVSFLAACTPRTECCIAVQETAKEIGLLLLSARHHPS